MTDDHYPKTEYRCPHCGTYCNPSLGADEFYCVTHGWIDTDDATHTTDSY
jgi:hypothetical protein